MKKKEVKKKIGVDCQTNTFIFKKILEAKKSIKKSLKQKSVGIHQRKAKLMRLLFSQLTEKGWSEEVLLALHDLHSVLGLRLKGLSTHATTEWANDTEFQIILTFGLKQQKKQSRLVDKKKK